MLATTPEGLAWLSQFKGPDQEVFARFLSSMVLVSHDAFRTRIRELVIGLLNSLSPSEPVALYAIREMADGRDYFLPDGRCRAPSVDGSGRVGSEGELAFVVSRLKSEHGTKVLDHPGPGQLRKHEVRHLVLLDDIAGSGDRTRKFLAALFRQRRLTSLLSLQRLEIHVVCYAVSEQAERRLRTIPTWRGEYSRAKRLRFHYYERPTVCSTVWTASEQKTLRRLCRSYGRKARIRSVYYTGYSDSLGALAFAHGCPNNVPGILWGGASGWQPLFPNQMGAADLNDSPAHP